MIPVRGRLTIREVATGKVIVAGEDVTLTMRVARNPEKPTAIAVTEGVNVPCNPQAS